MTIRSARVVHRRWQCRFGWHHWEHCWNPRSDHRYDLCFSCLKEREPS